MALEDIRPCSMCKKLFRAYGGSICGSCLDQIELDFRKVKDYLYEHPEDMGVKALSKATEVPERTVLHLMREGRIEVRDTTDGLTCRVCKRPISSGTLCDPCSLALARSLSGLNPAAGPETPASRGEHPKASDTSRMHLSRRLRDD